MNGKLHTLLNLDIIKNPIGCPANRFISSLARSQHYVHSITKQTWHYACSVAILFDLFQGLWLFINTLSPYAYSDLLL